MALHLYDVRGVSVEPPTGWICEFEQRVRVSVLKRVLFSAGANVVILLLDYGFVYMFACVTYACY